MKKMKDVMTANVQVVQPEASVREVANLMKTLDTGFIPVCDGERLLGSVTDRDIVIRAIADAADPSQLRARDIMSSPIIYCFEDQEIDEVARILEQKQVRRIVVLNRDKKLVGVASLGDLVEHSRDLGGEVLERVSEQNVSNSPQGKVA